MENSTKMMESLIIAKKTKGHKITKKESEEYKTAWLTLINEEKVFSEKVEEYFYEGFVFMGGQPFVQWVIESDDPYGALKSLITGKLFGKDSNTTFRILISVLANLLKTELSDINLVCPVIKTIPFQCRNKEKKILGDAHKIFVKYLLNEMNDSVSLPPLSVLTLKQVSLNSFVGLVDELIERLNDYKLTEEQTQALSRIDSWVHPIKQQDEIVNSNDELALVDNETNTDSKIEKVTDNRGGAEKPFDKIVKFLGYVNDATAELQEALNNSEKKVLAGCVENANLKNESELLKQEVKTLQEKNDSLEVQLTNRNKQIEEVKMQALSLEHSLKLAKEEINNKSNEIIERTKMIDALRMDRSRQSDEQLNRLASKLKIEYRDFKDAEMLEMDSNLGENMREQLKNVFAILIKSGITLE